MDLRDVSARMCRIPDDSVGSLDELKAGLVFQILDFQSKYEFSGKRFDPEGLESLTFDRLERLCDMMLMAIATSRVKSRN